MYHPENHLRGFTKRTLAALHLLAKSPLADQEIAKVEATEVAKRTALAERLAVMPAQHTKDIAALHRKAIESAAALDKAKQELAAAIEANTAAQVAHTSAAWALDNAAAAIRMELEKSADPRLALYSAAARNIRDNQLRHRISSGSNEAMKALGAASDRALELVLVPLTSAQVTAALRQISEDIRPILAAAEAVPPWVSEEDVGTGYEPQGNLVH